MQLYHYLDHIMFCCCHFSMGVRPFFKVDFYSSETAKYVNLYCYFLFFHQEMDMDQILHLYAVKWIKTICFLSSFLISFDRTCGEGLSFKI